MSILETLTLAVGLSMDAFSLSLIYGTLDINKKTRRMMSIMVGVFHFFMPIIGFKIGEVILNFVKFDPDILIGAIFTILSIQMLLSLKQEEQTKLLKSLLSIILFAFTVSIDSFSIGVGLGVLNSNIIFPSLMFALASGGFTFLGVKLGKKLQNHFGAITTLIGAILLLILGIGHLL